MATESVREFAAAKINLALHVTGRRADGYHLLDSLVVFVGVGDVVTLQTSDRTQLAVEGPYSDGLPLGEDNLVLRAARLMGAPVSITLDKQLPVASGIGGGSADAAATLRGVARLCNLHLPTADAVLRLGADVPVCLLGGPVRMTGIGEKMAPLDRVPRGWLVLVNPGLSVSTPDVFRALAQRDNPPMPEILPSFATIDDLAHFLKTQRNDLQTPAIGLAPGIAETLRALEAQPDCTLARMSGSGATCFGLFADPDAAQKAAEAIRGSRPDWWVAAGAMLQK